MNTETPITLIRLLVLGVALMPLSLANRALAASDPAPSAGNAIVTGLISLLDSRESDLMRTAELAPESLYAFQPTPDVRTFGQILAHVADAQNALCAAGGGNNVNLTDEIEKGATTKPAIVEALRKAFAFCRSSVVALSDHDIARPVPFGKDRAALATVMAFTISHTNEHYGNLVTYMRLNGIVPPSSQPAR